jgi:hypothetical protein
MRVGYGLRRVRGGVLGATCVVLGLLGVTVPAAAQQVVRVEEDWELVLGEPDPVIVGPQVTTTMSPTGNLDGVYFTFEINYRSLPWWTPGGLTIHQWSGEARVQSFDRSDRSVMQTSGETVSWTQILSVDGTNLTFQVKNGSSTTWGPFGYSNMFKLRTAFSGDLSGYSPDLSVAQSGAAFAGNRVQLLRIKEVRLTLSSGQTLTDSTPRIAHQLVE